MKGKLVTLILLSFVFFNGIIYSQIDKEFWFAAPEISHSPFQVLDRPIRLNFTTYSNPCIIKVSQPAGNLPTQTLNIPANSFQSLDLTLWIDSIESKPPNSILNYGLKIQSDNLISVYYEVNPSGLNPELYVLKGRNALGANFKIIGQNVEANGSHPNYLPIPYPSFSIVATENNTLVTINPSSDIVGHNAGIPFNISLNLNYYI